jgi:hypothetical protein
MHPYDTIAARRTLDVLREEPTVHEPTRSVHYSEQKQKRKLLGPWISLI